MAPGRVRTEFNIDRGGKCLQRDDPRGMRIVGFALVGMAGMGLAMRDRSRGRSRGRMIPVLTDEAVVQPENLRAQNRQGG